MAYKSFSMELAGTTLTVEVGRGAAPLGGGEFGSIWAKNKNVVIREAQLFQ